VPPFYSENFWSPNKILSDCPAAAYKRFKENWAKHAQIFLQKLHLQEGYETFYHLFHQWFPQPVVPVSTMYSQAVIIVEKTLKGKIMPLNNEVLAAVKHI